MNTPVADHSTTDRIVADCLVAFGSNEGKSLVIYRDVHKRLADFAVGDVIASQPVVTVAVGGPKQNDFLNAAFRFSTELSPANLHQALIDIESEFGRKRRQRWGARRIDLDLLLYNDQVCSDDKLKIPHPRMSFRRFVLEPACEIAAEMKHPTSGLTIAELLSRLNLNKNDLLWITAQFELATELIEELENTFQDWVFCLVDQQDIALFEFGDELPKLIVTDFACPDPHWHAASLNLTGSSGDDIKVEIQAAIEAMRPRP